MSKNKTVIKSDFENCSESYWLASTKPTVYPALKGDKKTDVAIVGAGITGVTTAFLLARDGINSVLIDKGRILQGTTGHTTAKITSQHHLVYNYLIDKVGREKAGQYACANQAAIEKIASIIGDLGIDCEFSRRPSYVYTQYDSFVKNIDNEVIAARSFGLPASYVPDPCLPFKTICAVKFADQAQFHPLKYLYPLAAKASEAGCSIYENTRALEIADKSPCTVITEAGRIIANKVVIATRFPFHDREGLYFARLHQSRSYILGIRIDGKLPEGMFISAELPVRSIRTQPSPEGDIVLLGGEGHRTGTRDNTLPGYEELKNFAKKIFSLKSVDYHWSAQDCISLDSIPYIGRLSSDSENIYIATGFKKWGMTSGTAAAMIISNMILGKENAWAGVFGPSRFNLKASAGEFIRESTKVAGEFISGKLVLTGRSFDTLKKGESRIMRKGLNRIGLYRDSNGMLFAVDTTCTHMGCELSWNEAEKTWDCPCHGSRFSYDGTVLEGPAVKDLNEITVKQ